MSLLPFVVAPQKKYEKVKVGNPDLGILEIEKYGGLSFAEQRYIKAQKLFNYRNELASLARRIAQATQGDWAYINNRINAYLFGGVITGDILEINGEDRGKIVALKEDEGAKIATIEHDGGAIEDVEISDKDGNFNESIELITPEFYSSWYPEIKELEDAYIASFALKNAVYATAIIKYRLTEDWSVEQTNDPKLINPELVLELAAFAYKEQNGWADEEEIKPTEATAEELGKS